MPTGSEGDGDEHQALMSVLSAMYYSQRSLNQAGEQELSTRCRHDVEVHAHDYVAAQHGGRGAEHAKYRPRSRPEMETGVLEHGVPSVPQILCEYSGLSPSRLDVNQVDVGVGPNHRPDEGHDFSALAASLRALDVSDTASAVARTVEKLRELCVRHDSLLVLVRNRC